MTIQWMDNFSQYGDTESYMLDGLWAALTADNGLAPTLENDPDGVSSGKVLRLSRGYARRVLSSNKTTVGVAMRLWYAELPSDSSDRPTFLQFADEDNAVQVSLVLNTTGAIQVYKGTTSGTLLGTTAVPALTANAWHHLECKAVFNDTTGSVEVRVNGTAVITLSNQDTVASAKVHCAQIRVGASNSGNQDGYCKDLICWDGDGSQNNDFMGDCQVVTLLPTSDSTFSGWASTAANGYSVLDETTPNDADYITGEAADTTAALFELSNLDADVTTVKGLQTVVRAMKTDGGAANLQVALDSNGDLDNGADRAITIAATYWFDVSELDPDAAAAWTPTTVNAAKLSIDRTA